jgi:leader peptidase (prepilin peptidase)/N-methyltransferase
MMPAIDDIIAVKADRQNLRPNIVVVFIGTGAAALLSFTFLPSPSAIASAILAALMVVGADIDARTYLLPDSVTIGATVCGLLAAFFLNTVDPWGSLTGALIRAFATASVLALLRAGYTQLRGNEGLGLGDVKLAAAVGAWLPGELIAPCFGLASATALAFVVVRRKQATGEAMKIPFGAFLCPALWLVVFVNLL